MGRREGGKEGGGRKGDGEEKKKASSMTHGISLLSIA